MKIYLPAYGACQTDIHVPAVIERHPYLLAKYHPRSHKHAFTILPSVKRTH